LLAEKLRSLLAKSDMMVVAGAPPPGSPDDIYARYAKRAREPGSAVLLDARGVPLTEALPHSPCLAKLNAEELAATCRRPIGTEQELYRSAYMLLERGAQWVLVTRGKQDAWLLNETAVWRFTPPEVGVLNAIGGGDATTAGIAAGLQRGECMPDAVRLGIACGSASATTLTPGDVDARLVKRLVPEVASYENPCFAAETGVKRASVAQDWGLAPRMIIFPESEHGASRGGARIPSRYSLALIACLNRGSNRCLVAVSGIASELGSDSLDAT
jgi:fructose-1-phosphate kinase PfkB-like protein